MSFSFSQVFHSQISVVSVFYCVLFLVSVAVCIMDTDIEGNVSVRGGGLGSDNGGSEYEHPNSGGESVVEEREGRYFISLVIGFTGWPDL